MLEIADPPSLSYAKGVGLKRQVYIGDVGEKESSSGGGEEGGARRDG